VIGRLLPPLAVLLLAPLVGAADLPSYAPGTRCACPAAIARFEVPLPRFAALAVAKRKIKIVAIGSSSTQGAGASAPDKAYPARLETILRERLPGVEIAVVNRGVGGEEAPQMLARFATEVLPEQPDLVIWQVGSNGALRGRPLGSQDAVVAEGLTQLRGAGIDVALMNAQYAPALLAVRRLDDYLARVADNARRHRAALIDRYDVMRHWVTSGAMTIADPITADGLHLNDLGYDCLARVLADALLDAARRGAG